MVDTSVGIFSERSTAFLCLLMLVVSIVLKNDNNLTFQNCAKKLSLMPILRKIGFGSGENMNF